MKKYDKLVIIFELSVANNFIKSQKQKL